MWTLLYREWGDWDFWKIREKEGEDCLVKIREGVTHMEQGSLEGWGKHCFSLIYEFCCNNVVYSASLSFTMFIFFKYFKYMMMWLFWIKSQSGVAYESVKESIKRCLHACKRHKGR